MIYNPERESNVNDEIKTITDSPFNEGFRCEKNAHIELGNYVEFSEPKLLKIDPFCLNQNSNARTNSLFYDHATRITISLQTNAKKIYIYYLCDNNAI